MTTSCSKSTLLKLLNLLKTVMLYVKKAVKRPSLLDLQLPLFPQTVIS